jgi:DNA-binding NarL/FixJ family response regulator
MRVLLADDHRLVRAGIRSLLEAIEGIEVVGEADSSEQALQLLSEARPDLLLTDIAMAGMNGLELLRLARAELPALRVIVLSMHASNDYVSEALRAGASGYLLKDAAASELRGAIETVTSGGTYLSPVLSARLIESAGGKLSSPLAALTPRQIEILRGIAAGQSTKEIAFRLEISVKTVETHRAQIMERLGIRDVAGLTRFALRMGLVSSE